MAAVAQFSKMANLDYRYSVAEMQSAVGGRVDRIYELDDGVFRIRISKDGTKHDIMARLGVSMAFTDIIPQSPDAPTPFASLLRKYLDNATVAAIEQVSMDRLVRVAIQKEELYLLYFEMFAKGNLVLCDGKGKIIAAHAEQKEGKRLVVRGKEYPLPARGQAEPFDAAECDKALAQNEKAPGKAIALAPDYFADFESSEKKGAPGFGKRLAEYVSGAAFTVYYGGEAAIGFSSIKLADPAAFLKKAPSSEKTFGKFHLALDEYFSKAANASAAAAPKNKALEKLLRQKEMLTEALQKDEANEKELRACADAIYLNYEKVSSALEKAGKKRGKLELEI